jgi:hypothetical protein
MSENDVCDQCNIVVNNILDEVKQLQAELETKELRIEKLETAVKGALSISNALWAGVGNHPASRYAKDVAYFEGILKGVKKDG